MVTNVRDEHINGCYIETLLQERRDQTDTWARVQATWMGELGRGVVGTSGLTARIVIGETPSTSVDIGVERVEKPRP